jgi:hypothetical protein
MPKYVTDKMRNMLAWQVVQSLNILEDGFDEDGHPTNCCPVCCGPCHHLLEILDDPFLLDELNSILAECKYVVEGYWRFWNYNKQRLRVSKIKKLWFSEDGSHKAICMSSNGIDESDRLHRAIKEAENGFELGRLKKRYVAR